MLSFIIKIKGKFSASISVSLFLFALFFSISEVQAAATTTIRGVAWWGADKGYVYFNCKDDVMGDRLDDIGNLSGGGKYLPPDDKFHFYAPPCLSSSHYVYIDPIGNLGGQAWNQVKGFISFSGTTTPPNGYGDLSANERCGATCNSSNKCWGCYVESQKKVYGWARVDSTGEWIKLDHALDAPVSIETCANGPTDPKILAQNSPPVTAVGLNPGDFHGIAIGHENTLGSMYLNCKNDPRNVGGVCYSDYKVYVETLTIGALTAPNFTYAEACGGNSLGATLGWCVKSGQQKAYEIVVSKYPNDFGPNPTPAQISSAFCKTGKVNSTFANQFFPQYDCQSSLEYNTNYYWWIRLYDENNTPTQWYQYFGNSVNDTDRNIDNNVKTFSTFKHRFPTPFFTWSPFDILVGTTTKFSAASSVYYNNLSQAIPCSEPNCRYSWTTTDSQAIFSATNTIETDIIFKIATDTTVSLEVTDLDNYMCKMTSAIIKINYDLPIWREIKAK